MVCVRNDPWRLRIGGRRSCDCCVSAGRFARIGALRVAATLVTDAITDADRAWLAEAGLDVVVA
jgi:hypothetical protein